MCASTASTAVSPPAAMAQQRRRAWPQWFAVMYISGMDLVGRRREMGEIEQLLERAAAGMGGLIVVTGPDGSGKTAVADAAADEARRRGFEVVRASPARGQPGRWAWAQLLRDIGVADDIAAGLLQVVGPFDLDNAARELASGTRRLVVVDDIDRGGLEAAELLAVVATRVAAGSTAVIATAGMPLGVGRELRLGGLNEDELSTVIGTVRPDARHALWLASRGLPGVARSLAGGLASLGQDDDPIVHLALHAASTAGFLEVDVALVGLLEAAASRTRDDRTRARVLARLAHELLGDVAAAGRRRALVDEAVELARRAGDQRTLAEVLDARLHALWDPAAADDRLATAAEIMELARASADDSRERHGLFWRFMALMELGRVAEAESALAAYERSATAAGDAHAVVMATSRHAMLTILRGRFDEGSRLIEDVLEMGGRLEYADTDRLVGTLRGSIGMERGTRQEGAAAVDVCYALSRRFPAHFFEATAAVILAGLGRQAEAEAELERILPRVLAGSGPRWLSVMAELAVVVATTHDSHAAADLYRGLVPYRGKFVVRGGANSTLGPVSRYLGLLATQLGRLDDATSYFEEAIALEEAIGALPGLARSLAGLADALTGRSGDGDAQRASDCRRRARSIAGRLGMTMLLESLTQPTDEWSLGRDGEDWLLEAGDEHVRLRDSHGLRYLRALLAAPGQELSALDLAAGGAGLVASGVGPIFDDAARSAYRHRLAELSDELDVADRIQDSQRSESAETERQAVLRELGTASRLGGRTRETSADAERARVNVTRTLRATVDRIAATAPRTGSHLRASIRTGQACRYQPAPGGPNRWHV